MEYPYSIKDLASKANKTQQSLQKFLKKNSEFVNQHTLQTGRFKLYDQAVMDKVISYYRGVPAAAEASEAAETAEVEDSAEKESLAARVAELETEVSTKDAEIAQLKADLAVAEEERKEMIRQNGSLLLLLQEEKQEKMLLLPAPRKSLWQRITGHFGSSAENQKNSPNEK